MGLPLSERLALLLAVVLLLAVAPLALLLAVAPLALLLAVAPLALAIALHPLVQGGALPVDRTVLTDCRLRLPSLLK